MEDALTRPTTGSGPSDVPGIRARPAAGRLAGKVVFVTGAARGQGRSHAVRLAQEGADIVAVDICEQIPSIEIPLARWEDLEETARLVEAIGGRVEIVRADVRDQAALDHAVALGAHRFGRLDVVCANAGVVTYCRANDLEDQAFHDLVDVNLIGAWRTCKAASPAIIAAGNGGSIILTSSVGGLKAAAGLPHYVAAKHGVIGLMRALGIEYAPHGIRVNAVCPTNVNTPMLQDEHTMRMFADGSLPSHEEFVRLASSMNVMSVPWVEPVDVSNAILFLASDDARFITGVALPVDAGFMLS